MTSFFSGLFRRSAVGFKRAANSQTSLQIEKLEPRHQCAVEVTQDGNYIVVAGDPDAGSLDIQHQPGDDKYDDKVLVSWSSGGVRECKAFDLYKQVERGKAVKNVEFLEVSSGRGRNQFWSQTRLSSHLNAAADAQAARETIFSAAGTAAWAG